jgi:hypothetical protein
MPETTLDYIILAVVVTGITLFFRLISDDPDRRGDGGGDSSFWGLFDGDGDGGD